MIITCEKCETRFKLDDARISADGVKVRCSRCKHAFRVAPLQAPGASDADVADALAREAVAPEPVADEQTQVLGPSDEHEDHTQVLDHDAGLDGKPRYYIEDVDLFGKVTRHGPVEVEPLSLWREWDRGSARRVRYSRRRK